MLWKFGRGRKKSRLSLVTRLMGLYTLSTVGLLLLLGVALYPTFHALLSQLTGSTATNLTLECFKTLILTLLMGSVFALLLGNFIAKKGLTKIQALQKNMEAISAQALNERLALEDWPRELKPLGRCFNNMLDRLEGVFVQLSQFSSDIAHELRHPIHCLMQITELELSKPTLTEAYETIFMEYMSELNQLSKVIEQLLFLARSEHNQIALNQQEASVQTLVHKLYEFYQVLAEEKNITLLAEGDALLAVDPILFQRIIGNLLTNAIQHTPEGGKILIKTETIATNTVQIIVQDTGVGIEEKHLSKLCDRFYRVDSTRQHHGGLGLGLAIVKSIVALHGGTFMIESKPTSGTSVYLRFPLSPSLLQICNPFVINA